jgi:hypothetical protein
VLCVTCVGKYAWSSETSVSQRSIQHRPHRKENGWSEDTHTHTHTHTPHTHTPSYHNEYLSQGSLQNTDIGVGYNPGRGEYVRVGQGIKNRGGSFFLYHDALFFRCCIWP